VIIERGRGRNVLIRYRDPVSLQRKQETIQQHPYFFVQRDEMPLDDEGWAYAKEQGVSSVTDQGHIGVGGEALLKVSCHYPDNVRDLSRNFKQTWEANIPFTTRALADSNVDIPMYEHRVWSLDAEWLVDSGRINMITVHDSYTDNLYTWFVDSENDLSMKVSTMECKDHPEGIETLKFDQPAIQCASEKELLTLFARKMMEQDPDVLMGWYLVGADIKQIAGRMRANKLNPAIMSPLRKHRYDYGDWDQPIPGRICFDLMLGFVKLWTVKNGQLPGRKLDDVAYEVLKERKVELENGHDTYYTDLATYIDYNRQDVRLLPRLNDMLNCVNHYLTLMHLCKCEFRSTPYVTQMTTALLLNDDEWTHRIPTKPQHDYMKYSGADIMEPESGIYDNLGILDIRAMYHSNVNLHNISWETLSDQGEDCGNGVHFSKEKQGAVGRLMDYLTDLRNEYKANKKNNPSQARKWDAMQYATKSLIASLYGVCGDSKYSLYHPKVADAITFTSRQTLGNLRDHCNQRGHEVVYGHTDSVFVRIDNPEQGVKLCEEINEIMNPIVVEFERWAERMIIKAKNRYAGLVTWMEGAYLDEPDYYVKGIELKQARMPKAMKDTMQTALEGILNGRTQEQVSDDLTTLIQNVINGGIPVEDLCMKGSLSRPLHHYRSLSGASAAADWAYRNLGIEYTEDDYFLCLIDTEGKYIGFDNLEQIDGLAEIGYKHIVERFIVNKASDLYDIVGWDVTPLITSMEGKQNIVWI
jgi:DNA polymerase elongation subunit (family B)